MSPRVVDELSFAEFAAACEGFERFHAAPEGQAAGGGVAPPTREQFYAALGISLN